MSRVDSSFEIQITTRCVWCPAVTSYTADTPRQSVSHLLFSHFKHTGKTLWLRGALTYKHTPHV